MQTLKNILSKMSGVRKSELETYWDNIDGPAVRQVTAVVVGCGQRGQNYAAFALDFPSRLQVVAVAEPVVHRRRRMQMVYNIEEDKCVEDWRILTESIEFNNKHEKVEEACKSKARKRSKDPNDYHKEGLFDWNSPCYNTDPNP